MEEYLRAVSRYKLKDEAAMREELVEALRVFDRQDVGQLDATELREALRGQGEALTDEDLDEIMNLANVQDNGSFDYMGKSSQNDSALMMTVCMLNSCCS